MGVKVALALIRTYRNFLSPLIGPRCRYIPTCSKFAEEAFLKYGLIKGGFLSVRRILRCNPLFPGGYDPVP